jgi:hypothetical protein
MHRLPVRTYASPLAMTRVDVIFALIHATHHLTNRMLASTDREFIQSVTDTIRIFNAVLERGRR